MFKNKILQIKIKYKIKKNLYKNSHIPVKMASLHLPHINTGVLTTNHQKVIQWPPLDLSDGRTVARCQKRALPVPQVYQRH